MPRERDHQQSDWHSHATDTHAAGTSKSRVEPETVTYLNEVSTHYATLHEDDERQLLLNNVLEEISGKELRIASDAATSRVLEQLLRDAPAQQLVQFMTAFTNEDLLYKLAASAFGSHVAEKILMNLDRQLDDLDPETPTSAEDLLTKMVDALTNHLHDYIMDKHATHFARKLLCVISGRDVVPKSKKQQQLWGAGAAATGDGSSMEPSKATAATASSSKQPAVMGGLAEKLAGSYSHDATAQQQLLPRYPHLLRRMVDALLQGTPDGSSMEQLAKNSCSGPYLQGLLRAAQGDRDLMCRLLPRLLGADPAKLSCATAGALLASIKEGHMGKLLRDDCYSRLLEVAVAVAPRELYQEFYSRFLKGRLLGLSSHHAANFVVQAALSAADNKQQVRELFTEVEGYLGQLLMRRRSGVVAALVAACGRSSSCQKEVCAAVARGLSELSQWSGRQGCAHLAPGLMTLDTSAVLGATADHPGSSHHPQQHNDGYDNQEDGSYDDGNYNATGYGFYNNSQQQQQQQRLSTPGCVLLASLLRFPRACCKDYIASVVDMSNQDLAKVARDPSGCRVLEALLQGEAAATAKRQLLSKLSGCYADVALLASGSYLVEKAFAWADLDQKEMIVSEISPRQQQISHCHWGPRFLSALGVESFLRNPAEWRKRATSAATAKRAYEDMFGGARGADHGQGGNASKKQRKEHTLNISTEDEATVQEEQQQPQQQRKKHKPQQQQQQQQGQGQGATGTKQEEDTPVAALSQQQEQKERKQHKKEKKRQRKQLEEQQQQQQEQQQEQEQLRRSKHHMTTQHKATSQQGGQHEAPAAADGKPEQAAAKATAISQPATAGAGYQDILAVLGFGTTATATVGLCSSKQVGKSHARTAAADGLPGATTVSKKKKKAKAQTMNHV